MTSIGSSGPAWALLNIETDMTGALVPEDVVRQNATTGKRRLLLN